MEPKITINGVELSLGQAMVLRVALTHFVSDMQEENPLGDDELGKAIAKGYADRGTEVLHLMLAGR